MHASTQLFLYRFKFDFFCLFGINKPEEFVTSLEKSAYYRYYVQEKCKNIEQTKNASREKNSWNQRHCGAALHSAPRFLETGTWGKSMVKCKTISSFSNQPFHSLSMSHIFNIYKNKFQIHPCKSLKSAFYVILLKNSQKIHIIWN